MCRDMYPLLRATTADLKILIADLSTLQTSLHQDGFNSHPLPEFAANLVQLSPLAVQRWVWLSVNCSKFPLSYVQ